MEAAKMLCRTDVSGNSNGSACTSALQMRVGRKLIPGHFNFTMKDHLLTGHVVKNANGVDVVGRCKNPTWMNQCHTAN
ncbi:hypothetical protein PAXRUDRAFT_780485 [Paxillus rubicundulus Ve08.2h10]|uniref:Uncharacterized protein n=1 Tax=Paxillus rubicundulus Ve08.2h10 TaxID=930991 RepID=A0A0D0E2T3_9AGAM|nr:hypothetical protein PAXRUDRAFT_780485 [Paxillus rubicundulus Ve08.2h10]